MTNHNMCTIVKTIKKNHLNNAMKNELSYSYLVKKTIFRNYNVKIKDVKVFLCLVDDLRNIQFLLMTDLLC